jgi:hypothetical protein
MALGAAEFDELVTSTLQRIKRGELIDQVMLRHPTLEWIRSKEKTATGTELIVNLVLAEDSSTSWTDDSGTFQTSVSDDLLGAAKFQWSDPLVSAVRLRFKRLKKNSGKTQVLNLLNVHMKKMMDGHREELVKSMHARQDLSVVTTDEDTEVVMHPVKSGQFPSLDMLISNAAYDTAQSFTVGGIDATTQPHWQSLRFESPSTSGQTGYFDVRKAFRRVFNKLHVANDEGHGIQKIIAGFDIFEEFEDSFYNVAETRQDPSTSGSGQTHYAEIRHGNFQVRLDPDCPPKRAYFVDNDSINLYALAGTFMEREPSQFIPGTLDRVTPVASILATETNQRRANGLLLRPATAGGEA